jgi:hypothetical protein
MVFVLQHTQTRQQDAVQRRLDEVVQALARQTTGSSSWRRPPIPSSSRSTYGTSLCGTTSRG